MGPGPPRIEKNSDSKSVCSKTKNLVENNIGLKIYNLIECSGTWVFFEITLFESILNLNILLGPWHFVYTKF